MTIEPRIPDPHIGLLDAWAKLRRVMAEFTELAHVVQAQCTHTHAVQYNPQYSAFKRDDCQGYPLRVCIACGLKEQAGAQPDPDSFSPTSALFGSEILAVYAEGYLFNHYILPSLPGEHRFDELLARASN